MELTTTAHYPLQLEFLVTDRNRADLDWTNGTLLGSSIGQFQIWAYCQLGWIATISGIRSLQPKSHARIQFEIWVKLGQSFGLLRQRGSVHIASSAKDNVSVGRNIKMVWRSICPQVEDYLPTKTSQSESCRLQ
jgi:hypothetical protein